jgi:hypothetical protein
MIVPAVRPTYSADDDRAGAMPRPHARLAGAFYLLTIIFGMASVTLYSKLAVSGNAAATAANITSHQAVFRISSISNLLATVCYVVVTALFYNLFRPVNRNASLTAAFLSLTGCGMGAVSCAMQLVPLSVLAKSPFVDLFKPEELQGLVMMFLKASGEAYNTGMIFFGFYCVLIGYLIFLSGFLPKLVGVFMTLAGLGWLVSLWPALDKALSSYTMFTGLLGEGSLTLWLLIMGVDLRKWNERAAR